MPLDLDALILPTKNSASGNKPPKNRVSRRIESKVTLPPAMVQLIPQARNTFSKVKEAREALRGRAESLLDQLELIIKDAHANGEFEIAIEGIKWLIEHMPPDEDGVTILSPSIDKVKLGEKTSGPTINVGFALGGIVNSKALPPAKVIDIKPED